MVVEVPNDISVGKMTFAATIVTGNVPVFKASPFK
jgi:hypothetical protein